MAEITRLSMYTVNLDVWGGVSRYNQQQAMQVPLEANILRLDSDDGVVGWGETCTPPPFYMPTLSSGAREAVRHLAPLLLGADTDRPNAIMRAIDLAMRGHRPAKSVIEMALWDLFGKRCGRSLVDLWGGRVAERLPVLAMASAGTPEQTMASIARYREAGYRHFQVKIGLAGHEQDIDTITRVCESLLPEERCWFDVNRGWSLDDAMQVLPRVAHLSPLLEQPCETYEECLSLSRRFGFGLMLDELIDSPDALIRAHADGIIDVAVLKLASTGGIGRQRALSELAHHYRIPLRIEDYFGTGITMAAVAQIVHSLPQSACFAMYDYHLPELPVVRNPIAVSEGWLSMPMDYGPGLGVEVDESLLGEPVFVIDASA